MAPALPIEFKAYPGYLSVRLLGRGVVENKIATFQAIAAELKSRQLGTLFIDMSPVPGPLAFMDRFQLGVLAGRYLGSVAIGVLARRDQVDPGKIGQLVAKNRGADVQLFTDPAEAAIWVRNHTQKS